MVFWRGKAAPRSHRRSSFVLVRVGRRNPCPERNRRIADVAASNARQAGELAFGNRQSK